MKKTMLFCFLLSIFLYGNAPAQKTEENKKEKYCFYPRYIDRIVWINNEELLVSEKVDSVNDLSVLIENKKFVIKRLREAAGSFSNFKKESITENNAIYWETEYKWLNRMLDRFEPEFLTLLRRNVKAENIPDDLLRRNLLRVIGSRDFNDEDILWNRAPRAYQPNDYSKLNKSEMEMFNYFNILERFKDSLDVTCQIPIYSRIVKYNIRTQKYTPIFNNYYQSRKKTGIDKTGHIIAYYDYDNQTITVEKDSRLICKSNIKNLIDKFKEHLMKKKIDSTHYSFDFIKVTDEGIAFIIWKQKRPNSRVFFSERIIYAMDYKQKKVCVVDSSIAEGIVNQCANSDDYIYVNNRKYSYSGKLLSKTNTSTMSSESETFVKSIITERLLDGANPETDFSSINVANLPISLWITERFAGKAKEINNKLFYNYYEGIMPAAYNINPEDFSFHPPTNSPCTPSLYCLDYDTNSISLMMKNVLNFDISQNFLVTISYEPDYRNKYLVIKVINNNQCLYRKYIEFEKENNYNSSDFISSMLVFQASNDTGSEAFIPTISPDEKYIIVFRRAFFSDYSIIPTFYDKINSYIVHTRIKPITINLRNLKYIHNNLNTSRYRIVK